MSLDFFVFIVYCDTQQKESDERERERERERESIILSTGV